VSLGLSLRARVGIAVVALVLGWFLVRQVLQMDGRFFAFSGTGLKGLALYMAGNYDGAARAYRAHVAGLVRQHRDNVDPAWAALVTGDFQTAKRLSLQQVEARSAPRYPLLTLGEVALAENDAPRALHHFSQVLVRETDQFDALLLASVAHARLRDYGSAIDSLKRALRYDRVDTRITSFLTALEATGTLARGPERPLCLLAHYHRYLRIFDSSHAAAAIRYAEKAIAAGDRADDA
jgi:tetratricopeptide (TPR) repeat protein